jgi:hypothetical protein
MNNSNQEKLNIFIRSLHEAIGKRGRQSEEILGEVRADLEWHVQRFQAKGRSEDEAVDLALGEMGNPYELAHKMLREIPPFGGKRLTFIRYITASALILWTLFVLWYFRAGIYGFSPLGVAAIVLVHFPVILLVWPRVVWRKNWMFGLIPAGLGLLAVVFMNFTGIGMEASPAQAPVVGSSEINQPSPVLIPVAVALGITATALLRFMQQRSQRRWAIIALFLGVVSIESMFQCEELFFRVDRKHIREYIETFVHEHGTYPADDVVKSEGPKLKSSNYEIHVEGKDFNLYWSRHLSPGHSIAYSSKADSVVVMD